jgi:hypothetical protein
MRCIANSEVVVVLIEQVVSDISLDMSEYNARDIDITPTS